MVVYIHKVKNDESKENPMVSFTENCYWSKIAVDFRMWHHLLAFPSAVGDMGAEEIVVYEPASFVSAATEDCMRVPGVEAELECAFVALLSAPLICFLTCHPHTRLFCDPLY